MDPLTTAVWALWFLSIGSRLGALIAVIYRRLAARYPLLTAALVVWSVRSGLLLAARLQRGPAAYNAAWVSSQWVVILLDCLLVVGIYISMARHASRFGTFGAAVIAAFVLASAAIVTVAAGLLQIPESIVPGVILATRHYGSICLLTLWFSYGFFRWTEIPMRRNYSVHVRALTAMFAGAVVAQQLNVIGGLVASALAQFSVLGGAIWAHLIWTLQLVRAGEVSPPPLPPVSNQDRREGERQYRETVRAILEALRDRWRLHGVLGF